MTIPKRDIQAHFAQYWPELAAVKLRTGRVHSFGAHPPSFGIETLRTTAYLLGNEPFENVIVPIRADVTAWADIRPLLWKHKCVIALYGVTIVEVETHDHALDNHSIDYHLRSLV